MTSGLRKAPLNCGTVKYVVMKNGLIVFAKHDKKEDQEHLVSVVKETSQRRGDGFPPVYWCPPQHSIYLVDSRSVETLIGRHCFQYSK